MKTITQYQCEGCGNAYASPQDAKDCEALGIEDYEEFRPTVGDIVECGHKYHWHSVPGSIWARSQLNDDGKTVYRIIFIVTAITVKSHRRIYHLYSPEPPQGDGAGWTSRRHFKMERAQPNDEREQWRDANRAQWEGRKADGLVY